MQENLPSILIRCHAPLRNDKFRSFLITRTSIVSGFLFFVSVVSSIVFSTNHETCYERCVAPHLDGRSRYLKENPRPRGTVKVYPRKKSSSGNAVTLAKEWEIPRQIPIMSTFFFHFKKATKKKDKENQQQQMERKNRKKAERIPLRLFSLRRYPLRVLLTTQIDGMSVYTCIKMSFTQLENHSQL